MFLLTVPRWYFFFGSFFLFVFRVCHVFLSVRCSLVVTCWERAKLLALLCMMFYCDFATFPCGKLVQVWCLIISLSNFSFILSFETTCLQDMTQHNSYKRDVNSTGPNSLVVKASASGAEGRRFESQCLWQWGLF